MKNTNVSTLDTSSRATRVITLSLFGVIALLMLSLAITASASTLTRQLELGSRGQDVSDLQTFLARDITIYPQGLVTGYFGFLTKAAVSNFQTRNGISSIGRVGPITLVAINNQMNAQPIGDNFSPIINSLSVGVSNTSATLNWNTTENASAIVYYSTSFPYMTEGSPASGVTIGGSSQLVHTDLRTQHSATITALAPNTTYYYVVYARDAFGNENITWPATFHTNN